MRVRILKQTAEIISSQEQLSQVLLARIPEDYRENFLHPTPINAITPAEAGLQELALQKAKERLQRAIEQQQKVVIFGDYDCDGVTATAVIWETLFSLGLSALPFLPLREKHGYGLSKTALDDIFAKQKPDLIITVDNGIVAHDEVAWLKSQNIDVIVTDHHEPGSNLPDANVILHSTLLSGVGVAWFLARELNPKMAYSLLDFVALGTVSDQIPLVGATRSLVTYGLQVLREGKRPSLEVLAEIAGVELKQATMNTIHYALAPRINAMGRLYHALDALRALVTRNPDKTRELMSQLDTVNAERQQITQEAFSEMKSNQVTRDDEKIIVVTGPYHEGVIGLIASKLVDEYSKPAIVISTLHENYKASCRSVPGVHITDLLRSLPSDLFLSLGGHRLAAGFSLSAEKYEEMLTALKQTIIDKISPQDLEPTQYVIGELDWSLLTRETLQTLAQFEPFGAGNREPRFLLSEVSFTDVNPVGKLKNHAQIQIQNQKMHRTIKGICFQYQSKIEKPQMVTKAIVKLKASTYRPGSVDIEIVAAL